jgi:hypothetical protein
MQILDKDKILDFMIKRQAGLEYQVVRDFAGGLEGRLYARNELKFWREAIERGEFDGEIQEVYIILSKTHPEIVDFTFYTEKEAVNKRIDELNFLVQNEEFWYITMYSSFRNSGNLGEVEKN